MVVLVFLCPDQVAPLVVVVLHHSLHIIHLKLYYNLEYLPTHPILVHITYSCICFLTCMEQLSNGIRLLYCKSGQFRENFIVAKIVKTYLRRQKIATRAWFTTNVSVYKSLCLYQYTTNVPITVYDKCNYEGQSKITESWLISLNWVGTSD